MELWQGRSSVQFVVDGDWAASALSQLVMRLTFDFLSRALAGFVVVTILLAGRLQAQQTQHLPEGMPTAPSTPNIVLILADDLGYGDLGCYGQARIKTPNIDALAAAGTRFTSFYAGSTVCAPSRCSLMTGMHTGHATIRGNAPGACLSPGNATLGEVLKGANYVTAVVGKWGVGDAGSTGLPGDKGFDEFLGYLNQTRAHDYYPSYLDRYNTNQGLHVIPLQRNAGGIQGDYTPDIFDRVMKNFVRIYRPTWLNHQRPFFLFFSSTLPHANNELGRETGNGMQVPDDTPYSNEDWPQPEKNKAAMITRLDKSVGEILAVLRKYQQESNTLILFTSDNGPHKEGGVDPDFFQSSGPLRGLKRDLYEGGIRVPLIAVWPGRVPAGRVSAEPWAFWDLLPTLAEVAGGMAPAKLDGISYLPTVMGKAQTNRHEFLYWELHEKGFKQAMREGRWKAVRNESGGPVELYDLEEDLGERVNVAAKHPEIVARLEQQMNAARTDSASWPVASGPKAKSDQAAEPAK